VCFVTSWLRRYKELLVLEAIREALFEEMRRDPKVFVLGEDVGPYGGAFGVTQGRYDEFGEMRVIDTPISESAIVGISVGAALRGYRPVAEMQFADFVTCGFDQIVNQGRPSGIATAAAWRCRWSSARRAAVTSAAVSIILRTPKPGSCTAPD
jgi:pyruvate/2-oxoglutarate/acetoin dehydrogenase E1 component